MSTASPSATPGFAIIGSGRYALEHLPALKAIGGRASTLKAVFSPDKERARKFSKYAPRYLELRIKVDYYFDEADSHPWDLPSLLMRPDISCVIIVMPVHTQPSIILRALQYGKHVLSQAPIAPDLATGVQLLHWYEKFYKPQKLIWKVAELHEAAPGITTTAKSIAEGWIGKVTAFDAAIVWRIDPKYEDTFLQVGVHYVAMLRSMLPSTMARLSGQIKKQPCNPTDSIIATVDTTDGTRGTFNLATASSHSLPPTSVSIKIIGELGWVEIQESKSQFITTHFKQSATFSKDGKIEQDVTYSPKSGLEETLANFFRLVLEGRSYHDDLGNPVDALKDVIFFEASLRSHSNKQEMIDLEQMASDAEGRDGEDGESFMTSSSDSKFDDLSCDDMLDEESRNCKVY